MSGSEETYRGKLLLVIDLATDRVIWFTDDLQQELTPDDCAVQAVFEGVIPRQMTVRNCWNYRLKNQELTSTKKPTLESKGIVQANRDAIAQHIDQRSAQLMSQYAARNAAAERLREIKRAEAIDVIGGRLDASDLLSMVRVRHGLVSLRAAAEFIVEADARYVALIKQVEAVRGHWLAAVQAASDANEIAAMRGKFDEDLSACTLERKVY